MPDDTHSEISKADYEALAAFRHALRRFLHFSEEGSRAAGLTPQQHQLLLAVKGQAGRDWATVTDLAEALQIRHHAAVGLVNRSVQASLVVRTPDPTDRRQVRVRLTEKGEAVLARLSSRNLQELRTLRQALRPPFLQEFVDDRLPADATAADPPG
jgi:DNA-binding MarR family transcriptional regulator